MRDAYISTCIYPSIHPLRKPKKKAKTKKHMMDLDLNNITAIRVLGQGATGTVFLVTNPSSPSPFALKVIPKDDQNPRRTNSELSILSLLLSSPHPFLPSLLGHLETPSLLSLALPFCPSGHLNSLRLSLPDRIFSHSAIRFYLSQLISALSHLHSLNIAYRDLKPDNILLQANGHLLLTDFDLSRHLHNSATSFVGTEEYVAPEVVRGDGYGFSVDWWALGVIAYEMAYGKTPFRGRNRKETFENVLRRRPEFVGKLCPELADLMGRLLEKEPGKRLGCCGGAEEVKRHCFFEGLKWDLIAEVCRPPFLVADEGFGEGEVGRWERGGGFDVRDYFRRMSGGHGSPLPEFAEF